MGQFINSIFAALVNGGATALQALRRNAGNTAWEAYTPSAGVTDHGALDAASLLDDDHTQYVLVNGSRAISGTLIVRQSGGVAGTDEGQISHDGTMTIIQSKDGGVRILDSAGFGITVDNDSGVVTRVYSSHQRFQILSSFMEMDSVWVFNSGDGSLKAVSHVYPLNWGTHVGLVGVAAGVLKVTDASSGGGQLEFPQVVDVGTPSTNSARIGSEDVAGTAELIFSDETGNESQGTPHAADAPAGLYDGTHNEEVHRTVNTYLDRVEFINLTRLARLVEQIAAGNLVTIQALPANRRRCHVVETLAEYGQRTGRVKSKRTWAAVQEQHQAAYNARREEEQAAHAQWVADKAENDAARAAEEAAASLWNSLKPEERTIPRPAVRPEGFRDAPAIREAKDIRKPKPAWLKDRGA